MHQYDWFISSLNSNAAAGGIMKKYVCPLCGYIYDPEEGDADENIEPGTPFTELPDNWCCPICGAAKDEFFAQD